VGVSYVGGDSDDRKHRSLLALRDRFSKVLAVDGPPGFDVLGQELQDADVGGLHPVAPGHRFRVILREDVVAERIDLARDAGPRPPGVGHGQERAVGQVEPMRIP
jgi:hypothetical protein